MADSSRMTLKCEPVLGKAAYSNLPVSAGHKLGNEDINGAEAEWNSVDTLETVGRPRLCRLFGSSLPHPTTDAGKDKHGSGQLSLTGPHHQQWKEQCVQHQRIQEHTHHSPRRGGGG
ncbi:hypothetical protein DPMN_193861 [Dreissena polymorpha]|uniref:Uncharacterized protein n=1 Tax=Dreissena polymorpha TaxID=45954 RepID=A0A9D4BF19_DREPO|nr:hypothetical protein DPMN_193861 [Dreissena polymorpha]